MSKAPPSQVVVAPSTTRPVSPIMHGPLLEKTDPDKLVAPPRGFARFYAYAAICNLLLLAGSHVSYHRLPADPDLGLRVPELIASKGYPVESHFVTTMDGYVLNIFRIPHGAGNPGGNDSHRRPAVLLQHALQDSSFSWVSGEPYQSLGFVLADAGYDVWIGNNRGNQYSTNHSYMSTASADYWDFTWDEMASYDLPAVIDHMLKTTGSAKIGYVGHSQGSVQAFTGLSQNKTLADQVAVLVALGPAVFQTDVGGAWGYLSHFGLMRVMRWLGISSLMTNDGMYHRVASPMYRWLPGLASFCVDVVTGPSTHLNITRGPVLVDHVPSGSSMKNMAHWEQRINSERVQKFDYGSVAANLKHYGVPKPPQYNLSGLSVPIAVIYGGHDPLASYKDINRLMDELPEGLVFHVHQVPTYGHLDFVWATDSKELLQPHILAALSRYTF